MSPVCSIIIPVYGQAHFTEQLLKRLRELGHCGADQIMVIDGASEDWTFYLGDHFGQFGVEYRQQKDRLTFAQACNLGAARAIGDFLVFLNNDTMPTDGWLMAMLKAMEDPEVGIVGSRLIFPPGHPQAGQLQHCWLKWEEGMPTHAHYGESAGLAAVCFDADVLMVTGACMMIRREVFEELNGFDERYENGCEDVDLCLRAGYNAWKVRYCADSILGHYEGQTPGRFDKTLENIQLFKHIHHPIQHMFKRAEASHYAT
tara:strand:+ start:12295 stop:13071 length:777 start_codon:yes stop_codon:yes gene_type:complete